MPKIIIDKKAQESPYRIVGDQEVESGHLILPLATWLDRREALAERNDLGVWLDAHEEAEALAGLVNRLPVIALNFPAFYDGRSLSNATILRRQLGYRGELRAVGDVRCDQLDQMQRCGINAFELAPGQDTTQALEALAGFTYSYQGSVDQPEPLFRAKQRGAAAPIRRQASS